MKNNYWVGQNWLGRIQSQPTHFLDLIRIYLGLALFAKGIFFLLHPEQLNATGLSSSLAMFVSALPFVHIVGGLLLACGLFSRIAAIVQIPILAGAVFLVSLPKISGLQSRESTELTSLVLLFLTLFAIWGAGNFSLAPSGTFSKSSLPRSRSCQNWLDNHSDVFIDLVRIALGVGLFLKGLYIMANREQLTHWVTQSGNDWMGVVGMAHYVIPAHLIGGILLALGLVTRAAAIAQIPILVAAVFWVHLPRFSSLELRENLELSALVLFLLMVISAAGSGRLSVDRLLEESERKPEEYAGLHSMDPDHIR